MAETVASLQAVFSADSAQFNAAASAVENKMHGLAGTFNAGISGIGNKFTSLGGKLTSFSAALAPVSAMTGALFAGGIKTASDFDSAMAEISARTGLVGADLQSISDFALQMGADTSFSAGQAADAFLQLLSSGQSATEAIATLPTVLDLAAASGEDLGFTADMLTDVMAAFGLKVEDAAMVSDTLARAAGASSATVASLGDGFANVGPIARQFGLDVNDTAAILALFSENGIKGAEAGTQLKSMLMNMTRTTPDVTKAWKELGVSFYDSQGNIRDLNTVMGELDMALDGLPIEEQNRLMAELGGTYGIVGLSVLRNNRGFADMEELMLGQASASKVASKRLNTFAGRIEALRGSVETLMIKAFTPFMNDVLKPLAEELTAIVNQMADWSVENPKTTNTIIMMGGALIALTTTSYVLGTALRLLGGAFTTLGSLISTAVSVISFAISPMGLVVIGLIALIAGLYLAWKENLFGMQEALRPVIDLVSELYAIFKDHFGKIVEFLKAGDLEGAFGEFKLMFQEWIAAIKNKIPEILAGLRQLGTNILTWIREQIPFIVEKLSEWTVAFWSWLVEIWPKVKEKVGILADQLYAWVTEQVPVVQTKLEGWGNAFIDWVVPAAESLLLKLPDLITDVEKWILKQIPVLSEKLSRWGTKFINWAGDAIPPLIKKLGELIGEVTQWIIGEGIPAIVAEIPGMVDALISFASEAITKVGPALLDFINAVSDFMVKDLGPAILDAGKSIAQGIIDGLKEGFEDLMPDVEGAVTGAVDDIKGFFTDKLGIGSPSTVARGWGSDVMEGLRLGLVNTLALAGQMGLVVLVVTAAGMLISNAGTTAGNNFITNLTSAIYVNAYTVPGAFGVIQTYASGMAQTMTNSGMYAGQMLVYGIAMGIYNNVSAAVAAVQYLGYSLQAALRYALGIYSPSKVFAELGENVTQGFAQGIENTKPLELAARGLSSAAMPPGLPSRSSTAPVTNNKSTIIVNVDEGVMDRRPDAGQYGNDFASQLAEQLRKKGQGVYANG